MKGRFLDAVIAAGREGALGRAGDRHRAGAQLMLDRRRGEHTEGDLALDEAGSARCARRCAPTATG